MHSHLRNKQIANALVAQLVEHLTLNQRVQGSNPCRRTKRHSKVSLFCFYAFCDKINIILKTLFFEGIVLPQYRIIQVYVSMLGLCTVTV